MTTILEYIWMDVYGSLRSKTKIIYDDNFECCLDKIPLWNFDGSSTGQSIGETSDVILKPVNIFNDPFRDYKKSYLILCETLNSDNSVHFSNNRNNCIKICDNENVKKQEPWFGIEQEYFVYELDNCLETENMVKPYGWMTNGVPSKKFKNQEFDDTYLSSVCFIPLQHKGSPNYCGVGGDRVKIRNIMEKHMKYCINAGIKICGMNLEVSQSQGEFQIGILPANQIGDHLLIARYILNRISEEYNAFIEYHPKPLGILPFNGSGGHTNFSTKQMRETDGIKHIFDACNKLSKNHQKHIQEYGNPEENKLRLTGKHETSSFDKFMFNFNFPSNRGSSLRIPCNVINDCCGYLEDRRPSSNMDPYRVVSRILKTLCLDELD